MTRTFDDPVAAYTLLLALVTGLLCYATWRLYRTTVQLATEAKHSGTDQADKMERSIEQATRAAQAMENLAQSNAANSAEIAESVKLNRLAMRARISVVIGDATYQEPGLLRFEGKPKILNRGATEARDVR